MDRKQYFEELHIALTREGFTSQPEQDELLPVEWDGLPLCRITADGGVRYWQEDVATPERERACERATDLACTVREYMTLLEQAPPLQAQSLTGDYRLLADFNGAVLAAHPTRLGVQFVTWGWSFDRTGLNQGNYFQENYVGAKQDFAIRAGLISKQQIFNQEQLVEIYRCCSDTLDAGFDLTAEQEKCIRSVQEQIAIAAPDIPQELRKQVELTQRLTKHIPPILETQERIKAMVMPLERLSAINSQIMNCQIPAHSVLNPTVIAAADMARQPEGTLTAALDATQNPTVMAATEVATRFAEPMGLAALQMSNLQLDTAALQFANNIERVQPPNYMTNIQGVLDAYSSALATVQSPFLDWLQTVDISPLTRIWERWDTERRLEEERYRELQKLHLQVMYQARWFPYASTLAGDMLFDEINEIIASSKIGATVSKRCEKRIDTAILSHYTKAEIKRIKKKWNDSEIEPYFKKALGQTLDAYLRKEYALVIPFLATMWEGIIKSKVGKNEKKFKEKCKDLVDENGYDEVFSDFFNNLIFGQCYSVNDVVDGIPNRNGVAHSWYIKYPSQKAALNAILLTDFVLSLKPKNEAEDIEKE